MKIGILTHHYICNFGAFLQTYALQEAISQLMPDAQVEVIDYINHEHARCNRLEWLYPKQGALHLSQRLDMARMPGMFSHARRQYLHLSPRVASARAINALGYDTIVIGSDEVWNYANPRSVNPIKLGEGLDCRNLIAYAPSVGHAPFVSEPPAFVREGLQRFHHLSARDDTTARLVRELGFDVCRSIDPTFLVPIPTEPFPVALRKPYILFYCCSQLPASQLGDLMEFAHEEGYALYGAGEAGEHFTADTILMKPFQWAGLFAGASYVVTGTFHGAVFAMINRKPFLCHMDNASRAAKLTSLLEEFDASERRLAPDGDAVTVLTRPMNTQALTDCVNAAKATSLAYLQQSLRG